MSDWEAKRFWTTTATEPVPGGWQIALDGKPVRTPFKSPLVLPTPALAAMVAAEWDAQGEVIDPLSMPATRAANSAIDKVAPQRAAVAAHLAEYGETDLTCYRAEAPPALVEAQARAWDPLLDWAAERYGARLRPTTGVMYAP
ncbi:MAG: ATP12 family protein, partial [Shimia sp.]